MASIFEPILNELRDETPATRGVLEEIRQTNSPGNHTRNPDRWASSLSMWPISQALLKESQNSGRLCSFLWSTTMRCM